MWYELTLDVDDGTFLVIAPQFPEVTTFGCDLDEALLNGHNAIEEAIAARIADGDPVPYPIKETPGKGHFVQVTALTYLKTALYMICRADGVTRADLARELGWHREQVDRLFRLDHKSQLDQLEAAFKALNVPIRFDLPMPNAA